MDRIITACAIAAGSLIGSAASADMVKLADSLQEFSGVQGANGWSYGWYAGDDVASTPGIAAVNTLAFEEFGYYEAGTGWWTHDVASAGSGAGGSPFYLTVVTADQMHANAPIAGSQVGMDIRWASRRWTSDISGTLDISGFIAKSDQGSLQGDGVDAYILVDGVSVWYQGVEVGAYQGNDFDLSVEVSEGSIVEFLVGSRSNGLFDAVTFRSEIFGNPVPTPGAFALLGVGGLMAGRRRR